MNEKSSQTSPEYSRSKAWRRVFYGFFSLLMPVIVIPNFARAGGGPPLWTAGFSIIPISLCALFFIRCPSRYAVAKGFIFLFLLGGLLFAAMPFAMVRDSRSASQRHSCIANLAQIKGAKAIWALESHKTTNDTPVSRDLFGKDSYISRESKCPAGGVYTLGKVGVPPRCSMVGQGHSLD